jgi:glycosyltransferase involved in cell wall biosynthesis
MPMAPRSVTFIVPVYNKARYITAVLRAIDAQAGDFDGEIIVIDDGSQDATPALLAAFAAGRRDIKLLRSEDQGPAFAVNRAAALASGRYFKFVDGDDLLLPNATAQLIAAIEKSGAVLAMGDCLEYDPAEIDRVALPALPDPPHEVIPSPLPWLVTRIAMTMSGSLVTSAAFRECGGCDERVFVHDAPLFLRLARRGAFVRLLGPVALMPTQDPERWSNRAQGQVLHDVNAALKFFLLDNPDLAASLSRTARRRAAGRAWKFARRHGNAGFLSRPFLDYVLSRLPSMGDGPSFIDRTCRTFRQVAPIRVP